MLRRIISYPLAFLLLITNIGMPVFTHICHTQARSWSSIYVPAKSCCSKKKAGMKTDFCHLPKSDHATIESRPCCENQQGWIQLEADFVQNQVKFDSNASLFYATGFITEMMDGYFVAALDSFNSQKPHGPPLMRYGRSLLIAEQFFRC